MEYENEYILDLSEEGHWLARWHQDTFPIGMDKDKAINVIDRLNSAHRPNLEISDDDLVVCWNDHDKGDKCDYEILIENAYG